MVTERTQIALEQASVVEAMLRCADEGGDIGAAEARAIIQAMQLGIALGKTAEAAKARENCADTHEEAHTA